MSKTDGVVTLKKAHRVIELRSGKRPTIDEIARSTRLRIQQVHDIINGKYYATELRTKTTARVYQSQELLADTATRRAAE